MSFLTQLYSETSASPKSPIFSSERSAIHSGKLGDIIYSLPALRALGVNHLILNVYENNDDPLRTFPFGAARQLVPLLLAQPYLTRVSITRSAEPLDRLVDVPGVDYNLDYFRLVARHRIGRVLKTIRPAFVKFDEKDLPAHLGEHFSEAVGFAIDLHEPWLIAPRSEKTRDKIVISITKNWRTFPQSYWSKLLEGMNDLVFVGHPSEFEASPVKGIPFLPADNHLDLASYIAGARLFLGTVSFPYAIAEALKVPRAVEICQRNLNAFPVGRSSFVLSLDLEKSRRVIANLSALPIHHPFRSRERSLSQRIRWFIRFLLPSLRYQFTEANQTFGSTLRKYLRRAARNAIAPALRQIKSR